MAFFIRAIPGAHPSGRRCATFGAAPAVHVLPDRATHVGAISPFAPRTHMPSPEELFKSIQASPEGSSIAAILARHPGLARRTAQRWLNELVTAGRIRALGAGRARRYVVAAAAFVPSATSEDAFPQYIPLSADSRDILTVGARSCAATRAVATGCHR